MSLLANARGKMRQFKSSDQAQRFLTIHGVVGNLFRPGRYLIRASHYRKLRANKRRVHLTTIHQADYTAHPAVTE